MELAVRVSWLALALVHAAPAAVLFFPELTVRLYGAPADSPVGVLLVHRGALFLAVVAASLFAAFDPPSRRLASLVAAISMVGFLFVYWRAGAPAGSLRSIALVDGLGLAPLALVTITAWCAG